MTYGEAANAEETSSRRLRPEGLVEAYRLLRDVYQDEVVTYDDVDFEKVTEPARLYVGPKGPATHRVEVRHAYCGGYGRRRVSRLALM